MRKGIIVSAALHLGVIGAAMVTWPSALRLSEEAPPSVPVELITIAEATNIQAAVREPPPQPTPTPVEAVVPTIDPDMDIQLAEMTPPPPEPQPEPEPEALPEPEPEEVAQAEPEPEPPPAPTPPSPAPREKPAPEPEEEFDLDSVIALLDNRAPRAATPQSAPVAEAPRRGIGDQSAMTMNLRDAIMSQMRECWNFPAGAPNAEELFVGVTFYLAPSGELARAPQLTAETRAAMAGNAYLRAAAEAALRAVNICAPYRGLPTDQYAEWREIIVTFDPTKMAGR
jgi:outer membrane biosynthesis protein TonB